MQNESTGQLPAAEMDPERAAFLRRTMAALVGAVVARMLGDLDPGSTGTASERMMLRVLTPWLPKLRDGVLSRLSEADPVELERWMGATAWALDSILDQAPGDPLPRCAISWTPDGAPVLVPMED